MNALVLKGETEEDLKLKRQMDIIIKAQSTLKELFQNIEGISDVAVRSSVRIKLRHVECDLHNYLARNRNIFASSI